MADAATDNPLLTLSYQTDLASSSYTTLGTLAETTSWQSKPLRLDVRSEGMAFKIAQTNASSDTRFYSLEAEQMPMEQSRRPR